MGRKRRARSPSPSPSPPPRTPPGEESLSEEEEAAAAADATLATQNAPQNPNPPSTEVADADSSDGGEESSGSDTDADAFQLREVARSPRKPSESNADEEDGSSSDSTEPVQKKPKAKAGKKKKRQAAEFGPSEGGRDKKAKADVEKAAPVSSKALSEPNASTKGNKKQKQKAVPPDRSPSKPAARRWTLEDEIKVLEAIASHIKANGTQPSALELIAAVGDSLERNNCSKTEMYEKVRHLRQRHEKAVSAGTVPGNDDDLRKFNLSEAAWGESAKEVAAAHIAQTDGVSSKIKKAQTNKEKADDHSKEATSTVNGNVGTLSESNKAHATKEKADGDTKGRLSKNGATTDTSDAKAGTTKETTNTESEKSQKEKNDGAAESLRPKEAMAVTQNDDTLTLSKNGDTQEEKMDTDPTVKSMRRGFDELQNLYPNLTSYVESIQAQHPCGETLKRTFEFIGDEKACALESKIRKQTVAEMKMEIRQADVKKEVTNIFLGLLD